MITNVLCSPFRRRLAVACIALAGLGSAPAGAQSPSANSTSSGNFDATVVSRIHRTNQHEIKAGELAQEKGASDEVRAYGRRLVNDHRLADKKVTALAREKGLSLTDAGTGSPQQDPAAKKSETLMERLHRTSGAEFDRAFLSGMEEGHTRAISMLRDAEPKLQDADVRGLVLGLIPILEQHHTLATHVEQDGQSNAAE